MKLLRVFLLALSVTLLGACSSKNGSDSIAYSNVMIGSYDTTASFNFLAQTVKFTISWNESNGTVTGTYQDDYFATAAVTISGKLENGTISFAVPLAAEKDGVASINFSITKTAEKSFASITGKSSAGTDVFADNDVELTPSATGSSGSGDPTSVAGFFESIAGEYDWIATRSGGADDQWTEGKSYKIKITAADKKIVVPTEKGNVEIIFGAEAADKFESYDHESYISAKRGACLFFVQYQKGRETFMSCRKGGDVNSPFWKFKKEGGASTGVMADLGIGGGVGNFAWVVISASPTDAAAPYTYGAEVKFTINADGNITSDLGDFTYADANFAKLVVASDGKQHYKATWYSPNKTDVLRKEFTIEADDKELKSVQVKDYRTGNVTVSYYLAKTLP